MDLTSTPKASLSGVRFERTKRFARKPGQKSQRSQSKKSLDTSVKQMYIKSPTSIHKQKGKQADFFTVLAQEMISNRQPQTKKKQQNYIKYKERSSQRYQDDDNNDGNQQLRGRNIFQIDDNRTSIKNPHMKISTLQAQILLKNHQISILSGEIQRIKTQMQQDKQKRRKAQNQKRDLAKQLKESMKNNETLKIQVRKYQKQKQHLMKQIQFLQRINYDEKTRSLQSYRQKYLEGQLDKAKKQLHRSRADRQNQLDDQIRSLKQQKFTIQSHYKAMKVANQCLIKQINHTQQNLHEIILNSEQYKKLRDKYIRFLQQYKQLRNEYWALKAETSSKNMANNDSSSLFSITASQVEQDLTLLRNQSSKSGLNISLSLSSSVNTNVNVNANNLIQSKNIKAPKAQSVKQTKKQSREPTYSHHNN